MKDDSELVIQVLKDHGLYEAARFFDCCVNPNSDEKPPITEQLLHQTMFSIGDLETRLQAVELALGLSNAPGIHPQVDAALDDLQARVDGLGDA